MCGKKVTVGEAFSASELQAANEWRKAGAGAKLPSHAERGEARAVQLCKSGDMLSAVAGLLVAVGAITIVVCIASSGEEKPTSAFYIIAFAFYLAPWFFLFGQVMYIRAALEK